MLVGLQRGEIGLFPKAKTRLFNGFPLFPLCMLGGVALQGVAKLLRVDLLISRGQMQRISGAALDYLTDTVFERAKLLEVDVVDQSAKPIRDDVGDLVFPKMTWQQVRDQLGSGMDFSLVLKTSPMFDDLVVDEQASMGIREVTIG